MADLTSEIGKLSREVETYSEEQSTFLAYDKTVKEMAGELTELQVGHYDSSDHYH